MLIPRHLEKGEHTYVLMRLELKLSWQAGSPGLFEFHVLSHLKSAVLMVVSFTKFMLWWMDRLALSRQSVESS